jgi:predicted Rossmann-fold nucleotide-binding protein
VLVGRSWWRRVIDFDYLVEEGYIEAADVDLFTCVDEAGEIVAALERFHAGEIPGCEPA